METAAEPKFAAIAQDLLQLKAGGVILGFQQEYEKQRNEVVFSPYPPYILKPNALQWEKGKDWKWENDLFEDIYKFWN